MNEREASLCRRFGQIIRADWSMSGFDGRCVRDLMNQLANGELDEAEKTIEGWEGYLDL